MSIFTGPESVSRVCEAYYMINVYKSDWDTQYFCFSINYVGFRSCQKLCVCFCVINEDLVLVPLN